ncbi:uncharacterized protein LOC130640574 [Hydractinia symbiolongicarpus]|uniref:uncharacterized protein LOC130640574 n=1 Tax=Hydractinia symbiolongicarpus TaxID=13093 RepID=UPI00254C96CE|nr:uncharacterized protein LOC130640574 [Hydractinia symbiolongicarpus]
MELHLRITWKLFCCSLDVFKKRIATLVDDIKELHHVYIANLQQCNSTHSADAFVHLFIESEPNKVDETLTRKLHGKMEEILKGNDTSEVGKYFKDLIRDIKLIEVNEKNETKKIWKTWKIVIIVVVSIAFVICLAIFIVWMKSRGNRIRPIKKNTNNTILLK